MALSRRMNVSSFARPTSSLPPVPPPNVSSRLSQNMRQEDEQRAAFDDRHLRQSNRRASYRTRCHVPALAKHGQCRFLTVDEVLRRWRWQLSTETFEYR